VPNVLAALAVRFLTDGWIVAGFCGPGDTSRKEEANAVTNHQKIGNVRCVIIKFAAPLCAEMSINAATARHLHEQRIDLERRKRLEQAERTREKRDNPKDALHRIRIGDLNKMFGACYDADAINYQFPDDDAGRIDAMILAQHYANGNPSALARVLRARLPWMAEAEFQDLLEEARENPRFWSAQDLADALQLTEERRTALRIKTIGSINMTKRQRKQRRKAKNTEQHRAVRRAKGVKPPNNTWPTLLAA
jgi:hypothetical protein